MTDEKVEPPAERPVDERFFRYWDGSKERLGDPLAIGRKLERTCPDYLDQIAAATRTLPAELAAALSPTVADEMRRAKDEAAEKLLAATRVAFGVPEPEMRDGRPVGLTEDECAQLLLAFLMWMESAAEAARPFSTSRPRASPSTPPGSTAEPCAASGSSGT